MEEVDVTRAAQFYQTHSLFCHRPGPVYTIPEDVNERDGTIDNSESRMIGEGFSLPRFSVPPPFKAFLAREKKRQAARSVANSIICMYGQPPALLPSTKPSPTAATSSVATTSYTIISLGPGIHSEMLI